VIRISDTVLFDFDSAELRATAGPVLDDLAAALVKSGRDLEPGRWRGRAVDAQPDR